LDSSAKVYHLPTWKHKSDPTRIKALREIAKKAGRDPRIATQAISIIRAAGVKPRDTRGQTAALLKWTQTQIYYASEPGERLQDPVYTLQQHIRYGDCDDMALILAAYLESLRIPWRFVLSGRGPGGKLVRWCEGERHKRAKWGHIYLAVGNKPYRPTKWIFAEPTLHVPLGWDIVNAKRKGLKIPLPELAGVSDLGILEVVEGVASQGLVTVKDNQEKPFLTDVLAQLKQRLHPRSLVPILLAGLVTGYFLQHLRGVFAADKKRKR
jgi:hypothetical protein